ncbi:MAG: winged helix-turn-helix transcriptional regulator [Bacteroidetes bacterium]|jgi:DNA-binding transcriptional ArsR family regulator|nr:winged helix-turn-helix transcriptional regulator [Bacteroidota bacterium]MBT5530082.1 winged helix-turn-helix transcriptional regulator [Cytophagia bacterium]MBT3424399.1 winged helix-turn-helix transcriptional regulator [Bacteroidota bacterium]MBT3799825.1 winged helix-turn-helix transcriptional regulator [Bacteroidota bacterium]MBT3934458.1 winged helix-turn-helix transcriptional regulator [Bacteroidota bacterium]
MNTENTKSEKKKNSVDDFTDEILKDPVKKAIIELLYQNEGCFFGDIIEELNYPYAIIQQHLFELKKLGIIRKNSEPAHFVLN